jgi:nicotinamide-nucleotide amidase
VTRPRAAIVVTGSELVRGELADANGSFLAREVDRLGFDPARITIVGDRADDLAPALELGLAADLCVVSGGLGPTHDDRTVEVLASVAGRPLIVDEALVREIEAISRRIAERLGRPYTDFAAGVWKQAAVPESAVSLGLAGTAPGLVLEVRGAVAVVLPGPPAEVRSLWPRALEAEPMRALLARVRPRSRRVLRFFGVSESAVARALAEAGGEGDGLEATVCARDLEIEVVLLADDAEAEARAEAVSDRLRRRLREQLFADDDRPVEELVLARCRAGGLTLATAESCTGGLVGGRLTSVPGASEVYLGGVVAYSDEAKRSQLGVPGVVLARHGAVSAEAAEALAAGARERLGADVAVSVTGVAGPGGGTPEKPVGRVHIHAAGPDGKLARRLDLPGDRATVRARASAAALHLVRTLLSESRHRAA